MVPLRLALGKKSQRGSLSAVFSELEMGTDVREGRANESKERLDGIGL